MINKKGQRIDRYFSSENMQIHSKYMKMIDIINHEPKANQNHRATTSLPVGCL